MNPRLTRWLVLTLLLQGCAGAPPQPPKIERISAEQLAAHLPQPAAALPLEQIVVLVRQGLAAGEIIGRIRDSGSRYRLSAAQIVDMAQQGVPLAVLDHMVAAERGQIFDDMAAGASASEKACQERIAREVRQCRDQMRAPVWIPYQQPFIHCYPLHPGSPFGHCL